MSAPYSPVSGYEKDRAWHLDKKVPIALILTILMQTIIAAAYITRMDSRLGELEVKAERMENWRDGTQGKLDAINVTLGRVDERMQAQADILREIKEVLKRH